MISSFKSFSQRVEEQFAEESERLEDIHLEAAINAQLHDISFEDLDCMEGSTGITNCAAEASKRLNCFSPYVPTSAQRIDVLIDFVQLSHDDVFLDMGCGDGRVCLVAVQSMLEKQSLHPSTGGDGKQFRAIGIDVSFYCIAMAQQIYATMRSSLQEGNGSSPSITFYQADLTIDPSELLSGAF